MSTGIDGIGLRLVELRKRHKLTQPVMAAQLNVGARTYKAYELEQRDMTVKVALRACEVFKVSLSWLLLGEANIAPPNVETIRDAYLAVISEVRDRSLEFSEEKIASISGYVCVQALAKGSSVQEEAKMYLDIA